MPGGAPDRSEGQARAHYANMRAALRNPELSAYLKGAGGVMLGSVLLTSFLPLYLKEQMGLPAGTVVALDVVVMVGGALSSVLWGWAADRLGSRRGWPLAALLYAVALLPSVYLLSDPSAGLNPLVVIAALGCGIVWSFMASLGGRLAPVIISHMAFTYFSALQFRWPGM